MLNAASSLMGFEIQAEDGSLGTVSDFLFDDTTWKIRWMVVDTGHWLTGRKVLVHPSAVISAEYRDRELTVSLTKKRVQDSPDILTDRPVSQQMQDDLFNHYGWDPLWGGGMYGGAMFGGGMGAIAAPLSAPAYFGTAGALEAERDVTDRNEGDPHLRSITEVTGYHAHATDGDLGHVRDILFDRAGWVIRYLIIDTAKWWIGQQVLISPAAVSGVDWSDRHVRLDLTRDKVKSSPAWDPADIVTGDYERQLHDYYNWPGYGW